MRFVELFAGIGGFSLGFERAGLECVGHVEIEKYAQKVLKKHWPDIPLFEDVCLVKGDEFGEVDLLCGGFPCQDLSSVGKRAGISGKRSGLFNEIIRIAGVCRPKFIVLENVANLLSRTDWFGYVVGRLTKIGYDSEWEVIRASDFGLPHKRARIFIVAYPKGLRWSASHGETEVRILKKTLEDWGRTAREIYRSANERGVDTRNLRGDNGFPNRVDRLKCLGNSIVPQISEYIGHQIMRLAV